MLVVLTWSGLLKLFPVLTTPLLLLPFVIVPWHFQRFSVSVVLSCGDDDCVTVTAVRSMCAGMRAKSRDRWSWRLTCWLRSTCMSAFGERKERRKLAYFLYTRRSFLIRIQKCASSSGQLFCRPTGDIPKRIKLESEFSTWLTLTPAPKWSECLL